MSLTLLGLLVTADPKPAYEVARQLNVSSASLSRHANGLSSKPALLKRACEYFSDVVNGLELTPHLLQTQFTARHAVVLAQLVRHKEKANQK